MEHSLATMGSATEQIVGTGVAELDTSTPVNPNVRDNIAIRARQWYLEAINHPVWKDFQRESTEDTGFYVGGKGQWSKDGTFESWEKLNAAGRAIVSVNHVQAVVDFMTGYERQNRADLKTSPQGEEDVDDARLMSLFLKHAQEQTNAGDHLTELFEDGIITGLECIEVGVDYLGDDPLNGEIELRHLRPGIDRDIIWDPYWTEYDASDARFFIKPKWGFLLDLVAEYGWAEKELLQAVDELQTAFDMATRSTTDGPSGDGYGWVRQHPIENLSAEQQFFDPEGQRLLVLEVWYRVYESIWVVTDKKLGTVIDTGVDDEPLTRESARDIAKGDPKHLKAVEKRVRRVRMATVIPATRQVLEEDQNPYENDDKHYPFAVYQAKRKGDIIYGVVRNLKDPQRIENKRYSQILDILGRYANIRPMVPKGSMVDPTTLSLHTDAPIVYDNEATKGPPTWFIAPLGELARVLTEVALQMKLNMREVSGVNTEALGATTDNKSGIAIARRQAQAQVIVTLFYDNLRRTRKYMGQRMARRIQQVNTKEKIVRLTDEYGADLLVRINPLEASIKQMGKEDFAKYRQTQDAEGKPKILRDISALKYDVIISESPSTPTARNAAFGALMEMVTTIPQLAPLVMDVAVELSDIPERARVLERIRRAMPPQLTGATPQGAPGMPGAPAGPGAPPLPNASPQPPMAPAGATAPPPAAA